MNGWCLNRLLFAGVLVGVLGVAEGLGFQERKPETTRPARRHVRPGERDEHQASAPADGPRHGGPGALFGAGPFRASPEDRGPLQPGEEQELLQFAQEHAPRVYSALDLLRQRSPERYQAQLVQVTPRLRQLRRIYATNSRLGELIRNHADTGFEIEQLAKALRQRDAGAPEYDRDRQVLRERIAESVHAETEALELYATQLETERAARVQAIVSHLISGTAAPPELPPPARDALQAYQNAKTDAEREEALERLRAGAERRLTQEVETLRKRAAELRDSADKQVDRRLERWLTERPRHDEEQKQP
jgi:hypothetical protein